MINDVYIRVGVSPNGYGVAVIAMRRIPKHTDPFRKFASL
jgi:hypothetical protein